MKSHSLLLIFALLIFGFSCKPKNDDSKLTKKFKDLNHKIEHSNMSNEQKDEEFNKLWEREKTEKVKEGVLDDFISK